MAGSNTWRSSTEVILSTCCRCKRCKADIPQAHDGSFLLVVPLLFAISPSRAKSAGLQFGTDAGMSSVLLTMVLRDERELAADVRCESCFVRLLNGLPSPLDGTAVRLHAKIFQKQANLRRTELQFSGCLTDTRGFSSSWPACLCVCPSQPNNRRRQARRSFCRSAF